MSSINLLTVIQGKELELIASVRAGNLLQYHMDAMYLGWEYGAGVCVANNSLIVMQPNKTQSRWVQHVRVYCLLYVV